MIRPAMPSLLGTGPRTRRDHHGPTAAPTILACNCHGRPPLTRRLLPSARKPSRRILSCIVFLSPSTSPVHCFCLARAYCAAETNPRAFLYTRGVPRLLPWPSRRVVALGI